MGTGLGIGDIGYAAAFLGGVATLLSPCAAMLLPAFFAYAFTSRTTLIGRTGLFYLGLLTTLVPLGALAGSLGALLVEHRPRVVLVVGVLVIIFGVLQAGAIPLPGLTRRQSRGADSASPVSIYLLGTAYGIAGVCSGPILGSVLAVAALGGDVLYGGILLAVYAAGMLLPLLLLALAWDRFDLGSARWLRPRPVRLALPGAHVETTVGNLVSGGLFVLVGLVLVFTEGTAALSGVLGVQAQQSLEVATRQWAARIPDLAVILGLAVLAVLAVVVAARSRRRHQQTTDRPL
ncbi:cytochrome c biogenesis CcdA family protein [Gephyromycinifex aptenodytis]|uniref:cytochrome c biogenesis CcdA family protein n=1 Tax=Gephyromycinifex aptenodytis TaxID=2716227 RepID=UPI001D0345D7|nr:cytochrome c biogenesis CcdA family protein [Gephyromycinifex aptenodytis]